jgi:gamma-glutamylcyclotransferase (GGCT)/AIG2-like uncharacterized protein YtfP
VRVLYFAYASNMEPTQFQGRCPDHEFRSVAKVDHYRLAFTRWSRSWNSGTADILPSRDGEVYGVLYEVTLEDIKRLDKFTLSPQAYVRADLIVKTGREKLPALTYFAVREGTFLPSQKYLGQIIKGAENYNLPTGYLELLKSIKTHD